MEILEKIQADVKQALKGGDAFKTEVLRMLLAAAHNEEIAKGKDKELKEEDIVALLRREAKKRREASDIYKRAGRDELADKEERELELIKGYLPPELAEAEIEKIVREAAAGGETNFGKIMGQVMAKVAGRAEASRVSGIVKRILEPGDEGANGGSKPGQPG